MKLFFSITLYFIALNVSSQQDYFVYHTKINEAEYRYFMQGEVTRCLEIYDEVFAEFEFIFLKDLLIAAQIAAFNNKEYEKYITKGFEFGLKIDHLNNFPLLKHTVKKYKKDKSLNVLFAQSRKRYLEKIDFNYLDFIYALAIQDQIDKRQKNYDKIIVKTINKLMDSIRKRGYPGERILGVTDTAIFREKGIKKLDINDRARKKKITSHFVFKDNRLQFDVSMPAFLHHDCVSSLYKDVFLEEIRKGNMHPQDFAFINDFSSQYLDKLPNDCDGIKFKGLYTYSPLKGDLTKQKEIQTANKLRKELYMIPYELVIKKREFIEKYNFVLRFGYNGEARL